MPAKKIYHDRVEIGLRIQRDLLEEMRLAALREDRSLNSYAVQAIRRQLQDLIPPPKPKEAARKGRKRK